jgi:hypothetical protein
MGLLGRLTGWDQQKDAQNAVLASYLAETASPELKKEIANRLVIIQQQVKVGSSVSPQAILEELSGRPRIVQMNFIALACNSLGIPPGLRSLSFMDVQNPYHADDESSLDRIGVALADLSRRSALRLTWPGNDVRINFLSWVEDEGTDQIGNIELLSLNIVLANHLILESDGDLKKLIAAESAMAVGANIGDKISMQNYTADLTYIPRAKQMYIVSQVCLSQDIPSPTDDLTWSECDFDSKIGDNEIFIALKVLRELTNISSIWPKVSLDFQALYYNGIYRDYGFSEGDITANGIT